MKITVYTIKDCAFSKQEKEYLTTNKLVFEEKDLETNKDFLTEMLAISNNFAGTPVTRVEKDDGTISVLKGFTKEEFDATFGLASPAEVLTKAGSTVPTPANDTPIPPASPAVVSTEAGPTSAKAVSPAPIPTPPVETPVVETPVVSVPDPLKSVMDDLQTKSEPSVVSSVADQPIQPTPTDSTGSTLSPVPPPDAPSIPDFPAK